MAFVQNTLGNLPVTSGKVIFVDSGSARASDGNAGRDPNVPMATLDAAVARCAANNGDIIVLMPGHAESTITASIALDVNGIWVYGLGWGASRPTFTMTGTSGVITLSGDSVRLSNIRLVPGVASCTAAITVTGDDCIVEDCETVIHATSEFLSHINMTASARNIIRRNTLRTLNGAGAVNAIQVTGADELLIEDNIIMGNWSEHALDNTTASSADEVLNVIIRNNLINNQSTVTTDLAMDLDDNATGTVARNVVATAASDGFAGGFDIGLCSAVENYVWDTADQSAGLNPSASAT